MLTSPDFVVSEESKRYLDVFQQVIIYQDTWTVALARTWSCSVTTVIKLVGYNSVRTAMIVHSGWTEALSAGIASAETDRPMCIVSQVPFIDLEFLRRDTEKRR